MIKLENYDELKKFFLERRGDPSILPDASIAIPVNAQGDLENVVGVLQDIANYKGAHTFEVILAINNYPIGQQPSEVEFFRSMGVLVAPTPSVRRSDEAVCFSARMTGIRAANTNYLLLFDADCRITNPTALIDWYIDTLHSGTELVYSHVGYYDLKKDVSVYTRILIHHTVRWVKRRVLGIPTTRGSNYAVKRTKMLYFHEHNFLGDDLNVGPTFKAHGCSIQYSGKRELVVLTSGRVFAGGWRKLVRYLLYMLRYNIKMLPVRPDVKSRIQWGDENVRLAKKR